MHYLNDDEFQQIVAAQAERIVMVIKCDAVVFWYFPHSEETK